MDGEFVNGADFFQLERMNQQQLSKIQTIERPFNN